MSFSIKKSLLLSVCVSHLFIANAFTMEIDLSSRAEPSKLVIEKHCTGTGVTQAAIDSILADGKYALRSGAPIALAAALGKDPKNRTAHQKLSELHEVLEHVGSAIRSMATNGATHGDVQAITDKLATTQAALKAFTDKIVETLATKGDISGETTKIVQAVEKLSTAITNISSLDTKLGTVNTNLTEIDQSIDALNINFQSLTSTVGQLSDLMKAVKESALREELLGLTTTVDNIMNAAFSEWVVVNSVNIVFSTSGGLEKPSLLTNGTWSGDQVSQGACVIRAGGRLVELFSVDARCPSEEDFYLLTPAQRLGRVF